MGRSEFNFHARIQHIVYDMNRMVCNISVSMDNHHHLDRVESILREDKHDDDNEYDQEDSILDIDLNKHRLKEEESIHHPTIVNNLFGIHRGLNC